VADASSHILSRPIDWSRVQVVYGGAQKNIGPAGVTIVIVREDLIGFAHPLCPSAFNWRLVAEYDSMYNTPPTYAIYIAGLVFKWLKAQGGVPAIEQRNIAKARALYDFLDQSDFYRNEIDPSCRSRMNVPFFLRDESRNEAFLTQARERPGTAQGPQVRGRNACKHLQRDAARGCYRADRVHARIRAYRRLTAVSRAAHSHARGVASPQTFRGRLSRGPPGLDMTEQDKSPPPMPPHRKPGARTLLDPARRSRRCRPIWRRCAPRSTPSTVNCWRCSIVAPSSPSTWARSRRSTAPRYFVPNASCR
jgi:hypothetical protein